MSMTKQLWSAIIVCMLLALCGSLLASLLSARSYLSQQLTLKNIDNANSLALALSQSDVDAVKIEVTVAALSDSGQYRLIRVVDPSGVVVVEKRSPFVTDDAPQWFVSLLPINAVPGTAQISSGWRQIGTLTLESENRFAYHSLWRSAVQMSVAMGIACLIAGYLGSLILRRLIPPLNMVVDQATGITERRFTIISPPRVPELAKLAEAMNQMVKRLQAIFEQEAGRLESLRRAANFDPVTGLANRQFFMARLAQTLADAASDNLLIVIRISRLSDINQQFGRATTDDLLKAIGTKLDALAAPGSDDQLAYPGRLNGADFALLCGAQHADAVSQTLIDALKEAAPRFGIDPEHFVHAGAVRFAPGADLSRVLAQADAALATAEADGRSGIVHGSLDAHQPHPTSSAAWELTLRTALEQRQVRLETYPIVDRHHQLIAQECPLRLRFGDSAEWQAARQFLPVAERLQMTAQIDLTSVALGLDLIETHGHQTAVALNLSPQSVADAGFRRQLAAMIGKHRAAAGKLWLEISEQGALLHLDAVSALCRELAPFGCRIGIEHFGHQFSQIGRLHQIGLHYLSIDSSFIAGIDQNPGNQAFLQGVRAITRIVGLELYAEGVASDAEFQQLVQLGFDAATGPGIAAN